MEPTILIIGAGVTGLSAANLLEKYGINYRIYEANEKIGGRIQTNIIQEFRIDRGFQVFNDAYEHQKIIFDVSSLNALNFSSAAFIGRTLKSSKIVGHPLKHPKYLWHTLTHPSFSLSDKIAILKLSFQAMTGKLYRDGPTDISTRHLLEQYGLSNRAVNDFFRPFFGGVFLDPELQTSSKFFYFALKNFVLGNVGLPKLGMQAIPEKIADPIPKEKIKLGHKVQAISDTSITLENGETVYGNAVMLCVDSHTAHRLLQKNSSNSRLWRHTFCFHFVALRAPYDEPIIFLNSNCQNHVIHFCPITNVQPSYSPDTRALISVTAHADENMPLKDLKEIVKKELVTICGEQASHWRLLDSRFIQRALPDQSPGTLTPWHRTRMESPTLFIGGDFTENNSIDGAIQAGITLAQMVKAQFN